jgi:Ca2+-dependent lipid-binding protein
MMYSPNYFNIDLEQLLSGTPLDSAIGVLKVTIESARGLKAVKIGGGAPDPYVTLSLGVKPPVARTKTIESTANPSWLESQFVLVNTLTDTLTLSLYDYNTNRADNLLGTVTHELSELADDAEQVGLVGTVLHGGKDRGELRYSLSYYPVLAPVKQEDGTVVPPPDTNSGIVRLTIHQGKDLDYARFTGTLCPYAKVYLGSNQQIHRTPTIKSDNTPIWESSTEYLVADKNNSTVTIKVLDDRDTGRDPNLGQVTVKLMDLLAAKERQQDWFPLSKTRSGKVRLTVDWKPLAIAGALGGTSAYVSPIGVMRIWFKKAVDLKNVEAALGGKSDPYVRVLLNNHQMARTDEIPNNLNPEWDYYVYVPVHNLRERLLLEVMDYQNIGSDRSLGSCELAVADYVKQEGTERNPYTPTGPQEHEDPLRQNGKNSFKGQLVYRADFVPAVSLRGGVSFYPVENELEAAAKEIKAQEGGAEGAVAPPAATPKSLDVNASTHSLTSKAGGEATPAERADQGIVMSQEEILASRECVENPPRVTALLTIALDAAAESGVLVVQVISGQLAHKARLEVAVDDAYWPAFTTTRARSHKQTWDSVHEAFIRELDWSQLVFRLNADEDVDDVDIIAECKMPAREFLQSCLVSL